jgi:hypothetical protein
MHERKFHFLVDVLCKTVDGQKTVLRDYRVSVVAQTVLEARQMLREVTIEQLHDEGGDTLDAPLESARILRSIQVA